MLSVLKFIIFEGWQKPMDMNLFQKVKHAELLVPNFFSFILLITVVNEKI